jgi:hypothetical protein
MKFEFFEINSEDHEIIKNAKKERKKKFYP